MTVTLMRVSHQEIEVEADTPHEAARLAADLKCDDGMVLTQVKSGNAVHLIDGTCCKCNKAIFSGEASIKDIDKFLYCGQCFIDWSDIVEPEVRIAEFSVT